ncbi:MAG: SPOR domain-containing protein [Flavobacteriaceae bacterium]|nr:MAG: SPOR domain-containing protein [Flavobacteriaceae bacterium]
MQDFLKYRWCFFFICFVSLHFSVSAQNKEGTVRIETSAHVDEMLAQKKDYNKSLETFQGYKIQIYYGSEKECYEVKDEFSALFPDISTSIIFSTPQWKLQVGNYRTRLDADRAIVNIKKEYPGAIVLATEIEIE